MAAMGWWPSRAKDLPTASTLEAGLAGCGGPGGTLGTCFFFFFFLTALFAFAPLE